MGPYDRVLGIGVHSLERQAFFDGHGGTETRFDTVACTQPGNLQLHVFWQPRVGLHHVRPHGVAPHRRALHAAQHAPHGRGFTPGGVGVPGIFVTVHRLVGILVDAHQARVVRVAAGHRVVLQLAETAGEGHVLGAADVLIAQKHHPMLEQLGTNLGKKTVVVDRIGEVHADQFRADVAGQLFDSHGRRPP